MEAIATQATLNTFKVDFAHHLDLVAKKSGAIRILALIHHMANDPEFGSHRFIDVWDGREQSIEEEMEQWLQRLENDTPTYFSVIETSKAMCYQREMYQYKEAHWLYVVAEMLHVLDESFAFRFAQCKPHFGIYPKQATALGQSAHFLIKLQYDVLVERLRSL